MSDNNDTVTEVNNNGNHLNNEINEELPIEIVKKTKATEPAYKSQIRNLIRIFNKVFSNIANNCDDEVEKIKEKFLDNIKKLDSDPAILFNEVQINNMLMLDTNKIIDNIDGISDKSEVFQTANKALDEIYYFLQFASGITVEPEVDFEFKNDIENLLEKIKNTNTKNQNINLLEKIAKLTESLNNERNLKLRLAADMENLRRRTSRDHEMAVHRVSSDIINEFLPISDHLEMAINHANEGAKFEALSEGVGMVLKQFSNILLKFGVTTIDALGETFDPNLHEAMGQQYSDQYPQGMVISQWQKGYILSEKLLRAARVVVSKGPEIKED
jgi:molecular chaperone GrpE